MKKLTTEQYIEKAKEKHNNKYCYSKVKYKISTSKIIIICPLHGEFLQEANSHLRGIGCSKCSKSYRPTNIEFINKSNAIHNNVYDYSRVRYKNSHSKVEIICQIHGIFNQTPCNHLNGHGCNKCGYENAKEKTRKEKDKFINDCKIIHNNKYDYSLVEYINAKKKVKIICQIHGVFNQIPDGHLNGNGCPKCAIIKVKNSNTKDKLQFINQCNKIHNFKYDYSPVVYINDNTKIDIICKNHGYFKQKPNKHLNGQGCPICRESKLERKIRILLQKNDIKYIQQYGNKSHDIYMKGQFLDFYLPEYKIAIECQGEQHFKPVNFGGKINIISQFERIKYRDLSKYNLCLENKINILYFTDENLLPSEYLDEITSDENIILEKIKKYNGFKKHTK